MRQYRKPRHSVSEDRIPTETEIEVIRSQRDDWRDHAYALERSLTALEETADAFDAIAMSNTAYLSGKTVRRRQRDAARNHRRLRRLVRRLLLIEEEIRWHQASGADPRDIAAMDRRQRDARNRLRLAVGLPTRMT